MPSRVLNSFVTRSARFLDAATEAVLYGMVVFAPWAFGSTQPWSIQIMNFAGGLLGLLLLARIWSRHANRQHISTAAAIPRLTLTLVVVTLSILAYCLIAAANAAFTYVPMEWRQEPHAHIDWLPHSLDRNASWQVFRNWLALACVFWAVHDWLVSDIAPDGHRSARRLRRLIFVLAVNAALVAFEGILQRTSDTPKLLWFKATRENPAAIAQFGPYAYRSNAAQYFNLIWPVALGLWWQLHLQRAGGSRRTQPRHHWLLPCVLVLIAAPLISMSRGGVAVAIVQMGVCCCIALAGRSFGKAPKLGMMLVFLTSLGLASYAGWDELAKRLQDTDPLGAGRRDTYQLAERMTDDYPWFGVGPGAFDSVFQLYRNSPDDYWPAQLHNDWLEYQITFGRTGCALLLLAGLLIGIRWFVPGALRAHWTFPTFIWIAIAGCLLHARFDFPLQIYSIQFVFVLLCSLLFSAARRE